MEKSAMYSTDQTTSASFDDPKSGAAGLQVAFDAISTNVDRLAKAVAIHQERISPILRPIDYPTEAHDDKAFGPYSKIALDFLGLAERMYGISVALELTTDRVDV